MRGLAAWLAGAWLQGAAGQRQAPTTEGGYHCTSWSKTYSGDGCAGASQFGRASTGGSSEAGSPRAGAILGGSAGPPMRERIRRTGAVSVMKARMRLSAPQRGQTSGRVRNLTGEVISVVPQLRL